MSDTPSAPQIPTDAVTFENGHSMPLLGFGTWQIKGRDAVRATAVALETGYRHVDTATVYGNEKQVGTALRESGIARDEIFVTTKCPPNNAGRELETLHQSLEALDTDHVDLWLIHWPGDVIRTRGMWPAFIEARANGLARSIGVSNFDFGLIDDLRADTDQLPAVNQIEWSPKLFDAGVLEGHRARGVTLEGYSALRGGTLDDDTIGAIAKRLGRTPAQVIIRWHVQHGIIVIPKSTHPERIRSNADVAGFELTDEDMTALDGLGGSGD